MLEKFNQIAEQAATNVSRRHFLGRAGQAAMVLAGALGGLLALPSAAEAAGGRCCCAGQRSCYHRYRNEPCDEFNFYYPCKCSRWCD